VAHGDDPEPRRGHELDRRLHDGGQGALGADQELRQIESSGPGRSGQPVQPVATGLPPEPREAGGNGLPMAFQQAGQLPADSTTSSASTWSIVMP
jgi:hypothetical protein